MHAQQETTGVLQRVRSHFLIEVETFLHRNMIDIINVQLRNIFLARARLTGNTVMKKGNTRKEYEVEKVASSYCDK